MLETVGSQIGFMIWVVLNLAMYSCMWKRMSYFGKISGIFSFPFYGILLYTQNWTIFFWYTLCIPIIAPFLPTIKMELRTKTTVTVYLLTVGFAYLICFGTYGILNALNK